MTRSFSSGRIRHLFRLMLLGLLIGGISCDSDPAQPDDDDDDDPVSTLPIRVQGTSMGPLHQNVQLFEEDVPLTGATVTVNGVALSESESGYYQGQLPQLLAAGAEVRLRVESQGRVVEGVGAIPDIPELTTPASGDFLDRSSDVDFAWASPGNPDLFQIGLSWTTGTSSSGTFVDASGSAREGAVPTNDMPEEVDAVYAGIAAYNRGTFTGPADPESDMNVRSLGSSVEFVLDQPLTILGSDMGARFQNLTVYSGGDPVSGAVVTVNGVALGEAGAGYYTGQLPTALGAGEELRLRVESEGRVAEGVVTIMDVPVLIAPAAGHPFDPLADLDYSWTAAQDPELFEMRLAWQKDGSGSATQVTAPGSARAGVVPTGAVPDDPESVEASIFAYLRGEFTGPVDPDSDMRVRLEGPPVPLTVEPLLKIEGGVMSVFSQNVRLSVGDEPVVGATVTANGAPLTENSAGFYQGQLAALLGPDEELRLRVEWDGMVVEGVATIIEAPVLTSPVDGQLFDPGGNVDYTWTSARDPDRFEMHLSWVKNGSGSSTRVEAPGSARSGVVSASAVPDAPESVRARVYTFLRGTFTGPVHPDSDMRVRIGSGAADFTLNPPLP